LLKPVVKKTKPQILPVKEVRDFALQWPDFTIEAKEIRGLLFPPSSY
jgi:hypothetical protein